MRVLRSFCLLIVLSVATTIATTIATTAAAQQETPEPVRPALLVMDIQNVYLPMMDQSDHDMMMRVTLAPPMRSAENPRAARLRLVSTKSLSQGRVRSWLARIRAHSAAGIWEASKSRGKMLGEVFAAPCAHLARTRTPPPRIWAATGWF